LRAGWDKNPHLENCIADGCRADIPHPVDFGNTPSTRLLLPSRGAPRNEDELEDLEVSLAKHTHQGKEGPTATSNGPRKRPLMTLPGSIMSSSYMNDGNFGTPALSRRGSVPFFSFSIVLIWRQWCKVPVDLRDGQERTYSKGFASKARR
jgi:hypothetical protein